MVHELAHEMLHKAERRTATTKTVRETEAEAIAFVMEPPSVYKPEEPPPITSTYITATPRFWQRAWKWSSVPPPSSSPHSKPQRPRSQPKGKATPARHWQKPAKPLDRDGVTAHCRAPSSQLCRCTERRHSAELPSRKKRRPGHEVRVGDGTTKRGRLMRG